jgi:hypothetical protein
VICLSVNVDSLQELPATEPALEWCCVCGPFSLSTVATCFGCTFTG